MLKYLFTKIAILPVVWIPPIAVRWPTVLIFLLATITFGLGYLCGQDKEVNNIRYCAEIIKRAGRDFDDQD